MEGFDLTKDEEFQEYKALIDILNGSIDSFYNYRQRHMQHEDIKAMIDDIIYSELVNVEVIKEKMYECLKNEKENE